MIGLIVDGEGDYAAFRARYRGLAKVFRTDGPRGHEVSAEQIVESARKQIAQLRDLGCTRIAIVTDLESRQVRAQTFRDRCLAHARGLPYAVDLLVFVADRMLENWLLADIAYISSRKRYFKAVRRQRNYESTDGKAELKRLFQKGYSYNEIRHGQELFPLVRTNEATQRSASFAIFQRDLGLE